MGIGWNQRRGEVNSGEWGGAWLSWIVGVAAPCYVTGYHLLALPEKLGVCVCVFFFFGFGERILVVLGRLFDCFGGLNCGEGPHQRVWSSGAPLTEKRNNTNGNGLKAQGSTPKTLHELMKTIEKRSHNLFSIRWRVKQSGVFLFFFFLCKNIFWNKIMSNLAVSCDFRQILFVISWSHIILN